ncbi:hypothetical protein F5H01DRAFT_374881 [Linnemannia elongata]|nr:hypothetical protein F5H01DRAFT_374881 [Linnemannia elongata]
MLHSGPNANGIEGATPKEGVQVVRLASRNKTVQVATHFDEGAKKDIVLWDDILVVFRNDAYIQVGPRVVPFLKGCDFQNLVPWRIAATPGAVLDVIVKEEGAETTATTGAGAGTSSGSPPGSSFSNGSNGTPSQQKQQLVAPQQRDPDAEPVRVIVPPLIPQGLCKVAMAAFGHFDLPPDFLASLTSGGAARGTFTAATEAIAVRRAPQFVSGSGSRPQSGATASATEPVKNADTITRRPQIQSSPSSGDPTTFTSISSTISPKPSTAIDTANLDLSMIPKMHAVDTRQQLTLGNMYRERRDFPTAMVCFLEAAAAGDAQAQYNVGFMYNYGEGVPMSFRVALQWYEKAAAQADGLAGYKEVVPEDNVYSRDGV